MESIAVAYGVAPFQTRPRYGYGPKLRPAQDDVLDPQERYIHEASKVAA